MSETTSSLFFILGRERSGTTLLQRLLNAHPDLHLPQESPFIRHLYKKYARHKNWNDKTINSFVEDLFKEPYFNQWNIEREALQAKLHNLTAPDFSKCCNAIIACSTSKQVKWLGDKNPQYTLFANQLKHAFPSARFICIVRDYRAQIASMMQVQLETRSPAALAVRWNTVSKRLIAHCNRYPKETLLIRYEDLVTFPEKTLNQICDFLNLPYSDMLLNEGTEELKSNPYYDDLHHKSVKQPLTTTKLNEWKTNLTPKQIAIIEQLCGKTGQQLDYAPSTPLTKSIPSIRYWPAIVYGRAYFPFLQLLYDLPLSLRNFVFRKLIYPHFTFWKEMKNTHIRGGKE